MVEIGRRGHVLDGAGRARGVGKLALAQGQGSGGEKMRIVSGSTSVNDWVDYSGGIGGIFIDVDTSAAGFQSTPHYVVSLYGDSSHWYANGVASVYNASPAGFRIYLRWTDDDGHPGAPNPLNTAFAQEKGWYLRWTGIES